MTIIKNLTEKPSFFIMDFEGFFEVLYVTNIFDLHTYDKETTALFKKIEISTEMHFVSLFFLNEKSITTLLLMVHLKCAVVHYANLNSSSIDKPYFRVVEYAICFFFDVLFMFILTKLLSKPL